MYDHIFFDLDGTLADTGEGIIKSVIYALKAFSIAETDINKLKKFVGPPLKEAFKELYGFDEHTANQAVTAYREYYSMEGIYLCKLYQGIDLLLNKLTKKGKKLYIATSKPTSFSVIVADHLKIKNYFSDIVGSTPDNTRSKKSEILEYILDKHNINNPQNAIMIGDTVYDAAGASNLNIPFCGVTYGYGFKSHDKSIDAAGFASKPMDILKYID